MPLIHVALQEGFQSDTVVAHFDSAEVYRKTGLKTRMQIGKAGNFDLTATAGMHELQIRVTTRNTHVNIPIETTGKDLYVGVSITPDDRISYKITDEPFRYA